LNRISKVNLLLSPQTVCLVETEVIARKRAVSPEIAHLLSKIPFDQQMYFSIERRQ